MSDLKVSLNQLKLLLWKSFKLQKRSVIGTILELALPAFFAIILLPIRSIVKSTAHPNDTVYEQFSPAQWPLTYPKPTPPSNKMINYTIVNDTNLLWRIGYTPNNDTLVTKLMKNLVTYLNSQQSSTGGGLFFPPLSFSTEEDMIANLTDRDQYYHSFGGIVFQNTSSKHFTYKIRLQYSPQNNQETGYVEVIICF